MEAEEAVINPEFWSHCAVFHILHLNSSSARNIQIKAKMHYTHCLLSMYFPRYFWEWQLPHPQDANGYPVVLNSYLMQPQRFIVQIIILSHFCHFHSYDAWNMQRPVLCVTTKNPRRHFMKGRPGHFAESFFHSAHETGAWCFQTWLDKTQLLMVLYKTSYSFYSHYSSWPWDAWTLTYSKHSDVYLCKLLIINIPRKYKSFIR